MTGRLKWKDYRGINALWPFIKNGRLRRIQSRKDVQRHQRIQGGNTWWIECGRVSEGDSYGNLPNPRYRNRRVLWRAPRHHCWLTKPNAIDRHATELGLQHCCPSTRGRPLCLGYGRQFIPLIGVLLVFELTRKGDRESLYRFGRDDGNS